MNFLNSVLLHQSRVKNIKKYEHASLLLNGNSVTNWISSLLWVSILLPNFKSHNSVMSARIYFMIRVKDCKDVSIMSPQDEQWRLTSLLCILQFSCFTKYNRMQSKHKQTKCKHSRRNSYRLYSFLSRHHYTKSKNYWKRRYRIDAESPCLFGHPVTYLNWECIIVEKL